MFTLSYQTNSRLKDIEREYNERGQKATETIGELQANINHLREEIKRSVLSKG